VKKACLLFCTFFVFAPSLLTGQNPPAPATSFPDALLDGMSTFNLAILLQGDIRGNFGPCG